MRAGQIRRHLGALGSPLPQTAPSPRLLGAAAKLPQAPARLPLNLEFSPRDYITYLLSIDAEIEHCLMVQYLYAAYTLGGPQVPAEFRDIVRDWQEVILGVAKEEMGHLISVQNVLRVIGSPLHFEREDYPWDVPFYPFPFTLEPLTLDSLAKYVYAESPVDWKGGAIGDDVRARVHAQVNDPHQVAMLFNTLLPLIQDPDYLPDDAFQADTYPCQANWAEWGRGYSGGSRGNSGADSGNPPGTPDVLVEPVTCRDDAYNALHDIAQQGEATLGTQPSHFVRFLRVYVQMRAALGVHGYDQASWDAARPDDFDPVVWAALCPAQPPAGPTSWKPARPVAVNPYVSLDPDRDPEMSGAPVTHITHPEAALWASLHNLRYRMLLNYLIHSFTLYGGLNSAGAITPRGTIVNAAFGEMYNLRAISQILMQLPVSSTDPGAGLAGPPFQMPYTLNSPFGEANRWRAHQDLLVAGEGLIAELLKTADAARHPYLHALRESDRGVMQIAARILSGNVDTALL